MFLSDKNSAKNDDFIVLLLDLLVRLDVRLLRGDYVFMRGDCSVFKMFLKVNSVFLDDLICSFWFVWSSPPILSDRVRLICPVVGLFHIYKPGDDLPGCSFRSLLLFSI